MCLQLPSSHSYLNPPNPVNMVLCQVHRDVDIAKPRGQFSHNPPAITFSSSWHTVFPQPPRSHTPSISCFPPGLLLPVDLSAPSMLLYLRGLACLCSYVWLSSLSRLSPLGEITSLMPFSTAMVWIFLSPQMHTLNPNPQPDAVSRQGPWWVGHENITPWATLTEEIPESTLPLPAMWSFKEKCSSNIQKEGPTQTPNLLAAWSWASSLQNWEKKKKSLLFITYPVSGIFAIATQID